VVLDLGGKQVIGHEPSLATDAEPQKGNPMEEFTLKLPNEKTFDALDQLINSDAEPAARLVAAVVRDLADAIIVLSKIIAASNKGIGGVTRNPDGVGGE
jgi:hypothetical protein